MLSMFCMSSFLKTSHDVRSYVRDAGFVDEQQQVFSNRKKVLLETLKQKGEFFRRLAQEIDRSIVHLGHAEIEMREGIEERFESEGRLYVLMQEQERHRDYIESKEVFARDFIEKIMPLEERDIVDIARTVSIKSQVYSYGKAVSFLFGKIYDLGIVDLAGRNLTWQDFRHPSKREGLFELLDRATTYQQAAKSNKVRIESIDGELIDATPNHHQRGLVVPRLKLHKEGEFK